VRGGGKRLAITKVTERNNAKRSIEQVDDEEPSIQCGAVGKTGGGGLVTVPADSVPPMRRPGRREMLFVKNPTKQTGE